MGFSDPFVIFVPFILADTLTNMKDSLFTIFDNLNSERIGAILKRLIQSQYDGNTGHLWNPGSNMGRTKYGLTCLLMNLIAVFHIDTQSNTSIKPAYYN